MIRYRLRHETSYQYDNEVSLAHNRAVLTPRPLRHQRLLHHDLHTVPDTGYRDQVADAFGKRWCTPLLPEVFDPAEILTPGALSGRPGPGVS